MSRHAQIFESMTIMCAETGHRHVTGCVPELGMKSAYPLAADIFFTRNEVSPNNEAVNVMLKHLCNEKKKVFMFAV